MAHFNDMVFYSLLAGFLIPVLASSAFLEVAASKEMGGWIETTPGRFPYFVSIKGRAREHVCSGSLVSKRHILTTACCVEAVGPNPIVVIGPHGMHDDRWTKNVVEMRAESAYFNPNWTGDVEKGFDAALLKLPREVSTVVPGLAKKDLEVYPNSKTHAFNMVNTLKTAGFHVVPNNLCPKLRNLSEDVVCAYSSNASFQPGCSGTPLIMISDESEDISNETSRAAVDLVVGIVSYGNFSSLGESGTGIVRIDTILDWINDSVDKNHQTYGWNDLLAAVLCGSAVFLLAVQTVIKYHQDFLNMCCNLHPHSIRCFFGTLYLAALAIASLKWRSMLLEARDTSLHRRGLMGLWWSDLQDGGIFVVTFILMIEAISGYLWGIYTDHIKKANKPSISALMSSNDIACLDVRYPITEGSSTSVFKFVERHIIKLCSGTRQLRKNLHCDQVSKDSQELMFQLCRDFLVTAAVLRFIENAFDMEWLRLAVLVLSGSFMGFRLLMAFRKCVLLAQRCSMCTLFKKISVLNYDKAMMFYLNSWCLKNGETHIHRSRARGCTLPDRVDRGKHHWGVVSSPEALSKTGRNPMQRQLDKTFQFHVDGDPMPRLWGAAYLHGWVINETHRRLDSVEGPWGRLYRRVHIWAPLLAPVLYATVISLQVTKGDPLLYSLAFGMWFGSIVAFGLTTVDEWFYSPITEFHIEAEEEWPIGYRWEALKEAILYARCPFQGLITVLHYLLFLQDKKYQLKRDEQGELAPRGAVCDVGRVDMSARNHCPYDESLDWLRAHIGKWKQEEIRVMMESYIVSVEVMRWASLAGEDWLQGTCDDDEGIRFALRTLMLAVGASWATPDQVLASLSSGHLWRGAKGPDLMRSPGCKDLWTDSIVNFLHRALDKNLVDVIESEEDIKSYLELPVTLTLMDVAINARRDVASVSESISLLIYYQVMLHDRRKRLAIDDRGDIYEDDSVMETMGKLKIAVVEAAQDHYKFRKKNFPSYEMIFEILDSCDWAFHRDVIWQQQMVPQREKHKRRSRQSRWKRTIEMAAFAISSERGQTVVGSNYIPEAIDNLPGTDGISTKLLGCSSIKKEMGFVLSAFMPFKMYGQEIDPFSLPEEDSILSVGALLEDWKAFENTMESEVGFSRFKDLLNYGEGVRGIDHLLLMGFCRLMSVAAIHLVGNEMNRMQSCVSGQIGQI